jgi:hypothetical protein
MNCRHGRQGDEEMKLTLQLIAVAAALAVWPPAAVWADTCTFDGSTDEYWDEDDNWTCSGGPQIPDQADDVMIDSANLVRIRETRAEACKTLTMSNDAILLISADASDQGSLTLHDDAFLSESFIRFAPPADCSEEECDNLGDDPAVLHLAESVTISGCRDSAIEGGCNSECLHPGLITGADSGTSLRIEHGGCLNDTSDGLTIRNNVEIQALFFNEAVAEVEDSKYTMLMTTYQKKGNTGTYRVTAGKMQFDVKVSSGGAGATFEMNGPDAEIEINGDSQTLPGLLDLEAGTFDVNEDFCWEGNFDLGGNASNDLVVDVASGKSIGAGGNCP